MTLLAFVSRCCRRLCGALLLAAPLLAAAQPADPPARVATLSALEGGAQLAPDGRNFMPASLNWPVTTGTRLVVDPGARDGRLTEIKGLVEKPPQGTAPSNLMLPGRYILQPEVMRALDTQEAGAGGEIQLTDAMARMIGTQAFHAVTFEGRRFDCGSKLGFVEATLALALERPDMGAEVRAMATRLLG